MKRKRAPGDTKAARQKKARDDRRKRRDLEALQKLQTWEAAHPGKRAPARLRRRAGQ